MKTHMSRRLGAFTAALALGAFLPTAAFAESSDLTLIVNQEVVTADTAMGAPYIDDAGRTMLPLRLVNDDLGYTTTWTNDGQIHITGKDGAVDVVVQIGSTTYTDKGESGTFQTAPLVCDGRTYLPARDFMALYGSIYWDGSSRTVWIYDQDTPAYECIGKNLVRFDNTDAAILTMPEGYEIGCYDVPEHITQQKTIDGITYIGIVYLEDRHVTADLFRDDGDRLTHLTTLNGTTDFTVLDDTLYYTDGIFAGTVTGLIKLNVLHAYDLDADAHRNYTLDFVVNDCTLSTEAGRLIATSPDGTVHSLDPHSLTAYVW